MGGLFPSELMEWKRVYITQTVMNTFIEETLNIDIDNPKGNKVIAIHQIEYDYTPLGAIADGDEIGAQISKESESALLWRHDQDLVDSFRRRFTEVTTETGVEDTPIIHTFDPPLVILGNKDYYFGINSVGLPAVESVYCRVGYTIRFVKQSAFSDRLKRHLD